MSYSVFDKSENDFNYDEPDTDFLVNSKPSSDSIGSRTYNKASSRRSYVKITLWALFLLILCTVIFLPFVFSVGKEESIEASAAARTGLFYDDGFDMKNNWGSYSPYFGSGTPFDGISKTALAGDNTLPPRCIFEQVHVLHRHGDRAPSGGTTARMEQLAQKLMNMKSPPTSENLKWLETWEYTLSDELLVGAGAGKLFESGARFWGSHGRLLYGDHAKNLIGWNDSINIYSNGTARPKPLLRGTDQSRIQTSARAWAAGFFGNYISPSSGGVPEDHYNLLLMSEKVGNNNTLAGYFACPNAMVDGATNGAQRANRWVDRYLADAATRLQKVLPGIENLSPKDVLTLQDLCVFETAAHGSSAFCSLFTEQEWRGFEYHSDLKFYGDSAWGSQVAPATGIPWLVELKARLQNRFVYDTKYGVNVTLSSNEETFPLNQPFYADFTHDSVIVSVLSALQLSFTKHNLPYKNIKIPRQFIISRLTPFSARMYVEIISCDNDSGKTEYARIKLNDRLLPLHDLKYCGESEEGLCELDNFIKSLEWAINKIDFTDVCFNKHDYPTIDNDDSIMA